jgi:probable FeS assembly SUF system protein SufT
MHQEHKPIILSREVEATAIPSGAKFTMEKGTEVMMVQSLGGTHTVSSRYGLSRIEAKDQDALGMENLAASEADEKIEGDATEEHVWSKLKTVYDPEIPVNIVDLGLVYSLEMEPHEGGGKKVHMKMTLTAPGCGMGPVIQADAQHKILSLPGITEADVELVWDPPWNQDMISEVGKMKLGLI